MSAKQYSSLIYIKYISTLLVLLLPAQQLLATNIVKLQGKITMPLGDTVEVSYNDNNLAYYPKKFAARLDKSGKFSLSFPVPQDIYTIVQITHGNKLADIVVLQGDSLFMTVNAAHFDSTIHYTGKGGNVQNFVAAHVISKGRMNQYPTKVRNNLQKEPKDFIKSIDNEYDAEITALNKWTPSLPASFTSYWKAYYRYYNYFFIQQYPQTNEIIKLRRFTDTIPAANYAAVAAMPLLFNDSLLQVPSYLLYLTGALEIKQKAAGYTWNGKDTLKSIQFEDSVYRVAYQTMPNKSLEYYMAQNIYGRAKTQRLPRTEAQLSEFKQHWPTSSYMPLLNKQVGLARKLAPGQPAPDFDIRTEDGGHMKLSDLKGKVVYLGFWAGWCRPCVGEMISEKMVKDLIIKKPLQFVYASIGTDTAGERMITDRYNIMGLFTNFTAGWDAKEVQDYGVQSLPAYYLIDEDGNFALQHAPPPTPATELVKEIVKLFK